MRRRHDVNRRGLECEDVRIHRGEAARRKLVCMTVGNRYDRGGVDSKIGHGARAGRQSFVSLGLLCDSRREL